MPVARGFRVWTLTGLTALLAAVCPLSAQEQAPVPKPLLTGQTSSSVHFDAPAPDACERPLPINLPTALQLANVQAVDIAAASERIHVAAALLEQARALWLPTITWGADYYRHDGPIQDVSNAVFNDSHSAVTLGLGSGMGAAAILSVDDAIFAPLAAKQRLQARQADLAAAANDTLVMVTDAYFTVQQARGELAGAIQATRLMQDLVDRSKKMAPKIIPELEVVRAEAELARRQQAERLAWERWRVASAELLRVLRLDPAALVDPVEPPQLRVDLIDLGRSLDELIPFALLHRPELAAQRAQVEATLALLKQERLRPLIPSLLLRGASTNPGGTLATGVFFPQPFGSTAGYRGDIDVQLLWQLDNLGFGNRGKVHQRQAENQLAVVELFRIQDRVAAEVSQAYAQAQEAGRRLCLAEKEVQLALDSAQKNLDGLRQTKPAAGPLQLIVRPQEAVAAVQALALAYVDYYGAVGDVNRAQFRLYRALGNPAQNLAGPAADCAPPQGSDPATMPHRDTLVPANPPRSDP
jgi:outer membrane protein TolC